MESFKDVTLLLADDEPYNVYAVTAALEEYEFNIIPVTNGREAIEKLTENPQIDVVLMDIMMPEMDGYQAMRLIRKEPKWKDIPVIALTAKTMKPEVEKCFDSGASDFLSKPIDIEKLVGMIKKWLV